VILSKFKKKFKRVNLSSFQRIKDELKKMGHLYGRATPFKGSKTNSRKWATSTAEPLVHPVCSVISQTAKFICFLAVSMLQFKTW